VDCGTWAGDFGELDELCELSVGGADASRPRSTVLRLPPWTREGGIVLPGKAWAAAGMSIPVTVALQTISQRSVERELAQPGMRFVRQIPKNHAVIFSVKQNPN
jgi:hypothetical protein